MLTSENVQDDRPLNPGTNPQKPIRVIAISGGKGGIGKTNISVNLAVAMAKLNHKVMLMDADLALANIDVLLGLQIDKNLSHVLSGEVDLEDIVKKGPAGINIIPAASGVLEMTQLNTLQLTGLIHAFSDICQDIDTLIIDTAAGVSEEVICFSRAAQELILVVCDEPTSITDAYAAIKLFSHSHYLNHFKILVNMVNAPREGREVFAKLMRATDRFLDVNLEYIGAIPYDEHLRKAVQKQKAVVDLYPGCKVSQSFKKVAQQICEWPINQGANDQIKFFIERLVQ